MNLIGALRREERKLLTTQQEVAGRLRGVVAALHALNGHVPRALHNMPSEITISTGGHKLKGRKLSAAHRRAIKIGIAKAKARKAGRK
jgi:hypothetical protein